MKKQLAVLSLACAISSVYADDVKLVNKDGSPLTTLCISAAQSDKSVDFLATELGVKLSKDSEVLCNGKPIRHFIHAYREGNLVRPEVGENQGIYVVNLGDQKPETRLCLAALISREEFEQLRNQEFAGVKVENEVACNGRPLDDFVRHYRNRVSTGLKTASL